MPYPSCAGSPASSQLLVALLLNYTYILPSHADFTLMYQHCVGVLLKRDTDLATKEVRG